MLLKYLVVKNIETLEILQNSGFNKMIIEPYNFLEPLEATSIHATMVQLDLFCNYYLDIDLDSTSYPTARKRYNKLVANMIDSYRELIQHHYMTKREDSEFWRYYKNEVPKLEEVTDVIEICKHRSPNFKDFLK